MRASRSAAPALAALAVLAVALAGGADWAEGQASRLSAAHVI